MTNTAEQSNLDRAAALANLLVGTSVSGVEVAPAAPRIVPTGREVYAGGDIPRVLLSPANLIYLNEDVPPAQQRAAAVVFDTVLLDQAQADRLDALGVVIDPAKVDEVNDQLTKPAEVDPTIPPTGLPSLASDLKSDDDIRKGDAADLVAYVGQFPEERARVRALEEERTPSKRRATVINATEPTPVEDDEVAKLAAERAGEDPAAPDAKVEETSGEPDSTIVDGTIAKVDSEQSASDDEQPAETPADDQPDPDAEAERQAAEDAASEALAALVAGTK